MDDGESLDQELAALNVEQRTERNAGEIPIGDKCNCGHAFELRRDRRENQLVQMAGGSGEVVVVRAPQRVGCTLHILDAGVEKDGLEMVSALNDRDHLIADRGVSDDGAFTSQGVLRFVGGLSRRNSLADVVGIDIAARLQDVEKISVQDDAIFVGVR